MPVLISAALSYPRSYLRIRANITRKQAIRCVVEDTAARFVCVNVMIDAAMQKIEKTIADKPQ